MTSYATYRITEPIRLLLFLSLAILNDIPIIAIAWDNAPTPRAPVRWDMSRVLTISGVLGAAGVVASFLLFWYLLGPAEMNHSTLRTRVFLKLLVGALEGTQAVGTLLAVYGFRLVAPIGWGYALVWLLVLSGGEARRL